MTSHSDDRIRALLEHDPRAGWDAFIDAYTPLLLTLIERAGVRDHDEAMDVYVRLCERLADRGCERLRRHDRTKGTYGAWLPVVVRHVIVDWVRSRAGRRRLFGAVKALDPAARRVFELYYWDDRTPTEIAGLLQARDPDMDLPAVLDALARVDSVLTERHRSELLSMAARARSASSLDADPDGTMEIPDPAVADPEAALAAREADARFAAALAALPAEDAAIVRLRFVQGLSPRQVEQALHLDRLPASRVRAILDRVRALLDGGMDAAAATQR